MRDQISKCHPTRRSALLSIGAGTAGLSLLSMGDLGHAFAKASAPRIRWAQGWLLWQSQKLPLKQAISDLAAVGAEGIEYSPGEGDPDKQGFTHQELLSLLKEKKLRVSGMYFPIKSCDPGARAEVLAAARKRIAAMKAYDVGCMVMAAPNVDPQAALGADSIKQLGLVLNDVGRLAREEGVQVGLHPHLNTIVETPTEIEQAMAATDPALVKLSADTGHIHLGGGDVVGLLKKHGRRLNYLHFKDAVRPFKRPHFNPNLRELGRGEVDFVGVMHLLKKLKFKGWINIEQDSSKLTATEASAASMQFVNGTLKKIYT